MNGNDSCSPEEEKFAGPETREHEEYSEKHSFDEIFPENHPSIASDIIETNASTSLSEMYLVPDLAESFEAIDLNKDSAASHSQELQDKAAAKITSSDCEVVKTNIMVSIEQFIRRKRLDLIELFGEAYNVENFMDSVNSLRHAFQPCPHTFFYCRSRAPKPWRQLIKSWETIRQNIHRLVIATTLMIESRGQEIASLIEDFSVYVNILLNVFEDVSELEDLCDQALIKYRDICFNYEDYLFVLHISHINVHLHPLISKLSYECEIFTEFEFQLKQNIGKC